MNARPDEHEADEQELERPGEDQPAEQRRPPPRQPRLDDQQPERDPERKHAEAERERVRERETEIQATHRRNRMSQVEQRDSVAACDRPYLRIMRPLDRIDQAIIERLAANARLSNTELADSVGLTPAPCLRRVRRLEEDGVIAGYHARPDPVALGRGFEVLVNVDLAYKDRATVRRFEERVAGFDEVVEMRRMFGLPDYFLRIATKDLEAFERFVTSQLEDTPGLARVDSHLTMKTIKTSIGT